MSMKHFRSIPTPSHDGETTGRYVVTFREDSVSAGLASLKKHGGVAKLTSAKDFDNSAMDMALMDEAGGAVFPTLGVAIVTLDKEAMRGMMTVTGQDNAILDIEPERMFYALGNGTLPAAYLRGYRDAVNHLYDKSIAGVEDEEDAETLVTFNDDAVSTWGLKATKAIASSFTGRGIKVAVLDTGLDMEHPDFLGRSITAKSFIAGEDVQDGNGHGTHCIGTSCGGKDNNGRRYGIAGEASIFAGKVLSDEGSGSTSGIIAGIEWAIVHECEIISMSLGNLVTTPSTAYETVGRRALQKGTLIIAAAGNHGDPPPPNTVGQPANSPSIMAVAALNNRLKRASFSAISGPDGGANVDIAGPGVDVYSSVPMPARYDGTFSGTSMATPHVAGIAALWAQANAARGSQLWQLLSSRARRLPIAASRVGAGLVQAP